MFAAPDLCVVWISAHAGLQLDGERSRTQNVVTVDDYGRPVFFFCVEKQVGVERKARVTRQRRRRRQR